MAGRFRTLSHTADTGIAVEADAFGELLDWAACGMFSLMFDLDVLRPTTERTVDVSADAAEDLIVDLLSELLFVSETHDVVPCAFDAVTATPQHVEMRVGCAPVDPATLVGPPIKAVTYHDLAVTHDGGRWSVRIVFDV